MESGWTRDRSPVRGVGDRFRVPALSLALLVGAAIGASAIAPQGPALSALAQDATPMAEVVGTPVANDIAALPTADPCPDEIAGPDSEPWVRSELYFGTTSPDGSAYPEEDWDAFLDAEITPRFPAGLTVLTGIGQWQDEEGILQERSKVLIILFPAEFSADSSVLLEEIRDAYEEQFEQTSVLRADAAPVCTSF